METEDPRNLGDIQSILNQSNSGTDTNQTNTNTAADSNDLYDEIKGKQDEVLAQLRRLTESITQISLAQDNVASIRVEQLSLVYFNRQVRPLIDSINLIAWASSNMANAATLIQTNTFGDRKEIRDALKICYKMNDEIDEMLDVWIRRMTIYIGQLDNMDKNCPPFDSGKDS